MRTANVSAIGKPRNRFEGPLKVTGTARYAADHRPESVAYAYGIMSAVASGEVESLDATRAEAAPGVLLALHVENAPKFYPWPEDQSVGERRPPLQDKRIHYAGQFLGIVVAEKFEQARHAARLVEVTYRESQRGPAVDLETGRERFGTQEKDRYVRGVPDEAYQHAPARIDATYRTPVETHNAMELHAAVAWWAEGKLFVEDSTQWVVGQRDALACAFGLSPSDVVVRSRFIGGGFGGKLFLWPHTILAAEAARLLERPVKLSLDRRSEFTTAGHRPLTEQRVRIGADRQGRLLSLRHDAVNHTSLVHEYEESCSDISRCLYRCPNVATSLATVRLNTGTPTPMRGPGEVPGVWALESAIDELAVELGIDPLELRLRNMPERDEARGLPWSSHTHAECLRLAASKFGWERRDGRIGSMRDGDEILGWGIASATWPGHRDEARVRVELRDDGMARVSCATQDIGTGTYTVFAQVVSELTGLPFERIEVAIGDSALPEGPISGGSMATATVVPAIAQATRAAIGALFEYATRAGGLFQGEATESLRIEDGRVVREGGGASWAFADALKAAGEPIARGDVHAKPEDAYEQHSTRSFGAHCVEVRWDPGIARLRVSRVSSVIDAGRIINLKTASNQVYGSIVMGVGMALLEQTIYDARSGLVVTDNLADYLVPTNADAPEMDVTLLDRPDPSIGEFGARGIGEIGLTGIAPAIAAAVYHATGKRIRSLPITIESLLE